MGIKSVAIQESIEGGEGVKYKNEIWIETIKLRCKGENDMNKDEKVQVIVHYIGAGKPYKEDLDPNEKISQLKMDVLTFFGLNESQNTYPIYDGKDKIEDLNQTIGMLAKGRHVLQLKLSQNVVQG